MDMVDFVQNLVDDPSRLASFKHDPQAFLAQAGLGQSLPKQDPVQEITTVMTLRSLGQIAPETRTYTNIDVIVSSYMNVFIEALDKSKDYTVTCWLLNHSYMIEDSSGNPYFDLHVCYVDPNDPADIPQVLYIRSKEQIENPTYNCANIPIQLTIPANNYILVGRTRPVYTQLTNFIYHRQKDDQPPLFEIGFDEQPQ
ncbi:hypothetical protein [Herpetosiphon geysericola]|uniref:Uncharacterized protein n=1 Tax=Herpetosiphon geysericola TaxID=70996 RepID=A0A0P6YM34_9CHLR|nr:hypothetical protein [Herpetosiphon geysericola]KPL91206.1 hypothetical protein SE18_03435 [Herpetosiphon geysericola]